MQKEDWSGTCGVGGVRAVLEEWRVESEKVQRVSKQKRFIPEEVGGGEGC